MNPNSNTVQFPTPAPEALELRPDPKPEAPLPTPHVNARKPRGFAAMDRERVREIARRGGRAAHEAGTAHEFTTEEARVAGRKGGQATHSKRRAAPDAAQK